MCELDFGVRCCHRQVQVGWLVIGWSVDVSHITTKAWFSDVRDWTRLFRIHNKRMTATIAHTGNGVCADQLPSCADVEGQYLHFERAT
jgi:hypothetical protein